MVTPKKRGRGRPATGRDPIVTLRLPVDIRREIERVAAKEGVSRSEMFRSDWSSKLIHGLGSEAPAGFRSRRGDGHDRTPVALRMLLSRHTRRREFITLLGGAAAERGHYPRPGEWLESDL